MQVAVPLRRPLARGGNVFFRSTCLRPASVLYSVGCSSRHTLTASSPLRLSAGSQRRTVPRAKPARDGAEGGIERDDQMAGASPAGQQAHGAIFASALRTMGAVSLLAIAGLAMGVRPAHASRDRLHADVATSTRTPASSGRQVHGGYSHTGIDLAEGAKVLPASGGSAAPLSASATLPEQKQAAPAVKGVALGYDDLMRSMVYDPADVPVRHTKREIAEQLEALYQQYDNEDFDLGIKQFMIEQAIQQDLEDGMDKKGGNQDFEEKLAQALFEEDDDEGNKDAIKTEDVWPDAFTTEVAEEFVTMFGEPGSLQTAWRVQETMTELSYTQFWTLVTEGRVEKVTFYGPEQRSILAQLSNSAPGGSRTIKVAVPPDPLLRDHLEAHNVGIEASAAEGNRLQHAFIIQILRFTFPFMFISSLFWLLHTWVLDPMPNALKRNEFLRYRRELLYVTSKLNFRSPAREVRIDKNASDFIAWEDINGIDDVKKEIIEIMDYLKNPALLRQRGVARIGGVLLAGAPGTGKTLLAKSIAAESGVRMFTCSGTDFFDVYSGVGARRIRETFEKMRSSAPAILFVDEFDALGAARGAQTSGDESTSIINELLVQMDGFEDNNGVVVLGATNRPGVIDSALMRPGRFDRTVYMPLPDAVGRAKILQVHARDKSIDPDINWYEVARSMAGFTGADCMGLMQRAARLAARQGRERIEEEDMYSAMENKAVEAYSELTGPPKIGDDAGVPDTVPLSLRKAVAVYEAGKALLAYITPEFQEIARVSVCPFDVITGYTLFVADEDKSMATEVTRADMESHLVVNLAGRCAEKLVMGESEVTSLGATDVFQANMIAREMVLSMGMGKRVGPVDLMHVASTAEDSGNLLRTPDSPSPSEEYFHHATDLSTEQARVALAEVVELLEAGEAKAYYGLSINWKPLEALVQALLDRGVLQGREVSHILETNGIIHFPDPYTDGFGWEQDDATLRYPHKPAREQSVVEAEDERAVLAGAKARTGSAGATQGAALDEDAGAKHGWHWNMPYTMKRDLPDWYNKEVERYMY